MEEFVLGTCVYLRAMFGYFVQMLVYILRSGGELSQRHFDIRRESVAAIGATSNWQNAWQKNASKLAEIQASDKTPPSIQILSPMPSNGQVPRVDTYTSFVRGKVSDDAGVMKELWRVTGGPKWTTPTPRWKKWMSSGERGLPERGLEGITVDKGRVSQIILSQYGLKGVRVVVVHQCMIRNIARAAVAILISSY